MKHRFTSVIRLTVLSMILFVTGCDSAMFTPSTMSAGDWSPIVNGLQGRWVIAQDTEVNGIHMLAVYLELRNVSDVLNSLDVFYDNNAFTCNVVDDHGQAVPPPPTAADILQPSPYWLVLPYDSTLRFRVSVTGYSVPENAGVMVALMCGAWVVQANSKSDYYLEGTFTAAKEEPNRRTWQGTLELPKVRIPELTH